MRYVTGIHALNLPCKLDTVGDWHQSAIQWEHPQMRESCNSVFGDYGIESNHYIPDHKGKYNVANTIRALLDMLDSGDFTNAQGMNHSYVDNPKYDKEIFDHVIMLSKNDNWGKIDDFMKKEYKIKWLKYKGEQNAKG